MRKPDSIGLVASCPKCHEPVEIYLTKKEIKEIWRGFKLGIEEAQLQTEHRLKIGERA